MCQIRGLGIANHVKQHAVAEKVNEKCLLKTFHGNVDDFAGGKS